MSVFSSLRALDERLFSALTARRAPFFSALMVTVSRIGDSGAIWLAAAAAMLLFRRTRKAGAVTLLALGLCTLVNTVIIKNIVMRPRPYEVLANITTLVPLPADSSFPSGHTAAAFACALAIYHSRGAKYGVAALFFAALTALSRVYVGVHYPSDVLSGALVGFLCGAAAPRLSLLGLRLAKAAAWIARK
ncbi:MAG: phosphatase PAP2 family protein [Oscillospiraceae bacterium]|jgi:undecaprenyl-diphosphatase|nr:phosphatase PAP2 family protein [Oscillospiraceae bacterium]